MSDDVHYFEHGGRRWRRTDPGIPETLRVELVGALMDARRAVGAARRAGDAKAEARARARVQDAKVALGERGPRYWEPLGREEHKVRAEACTRALLDRRGAGASLCPSDVARVLARPFRPLLPLVREVACELAARGEVVITQRGNVVDGRTARGAIRMARTEAEPTTHRQRAPRLEARTRTSAGLPRTSATSPAPRRPREHGDQRGE